MNVNDIDYTKLASQELDELIERATAERYNRVTHYEGDACDEVFKSGDMVYVDGSPTPVSDITEGDVYDHDDGDYFRVDDIRPHKSVGRMTYHVTRTQVDD